MATQTIHGYGVTTSLDPINDYFLVDPASTGNYKAINRNSIMGGLTGAPADISGSQSFSNKTIGITNSITSLDGSFLLKNTSDSTKQAAFSLSGITTGTKRTYTLPNASVTLASLTGTETLTNKTITSPTITGGSIDNTTISVDAITGHTVSTTVTVGGVQMANGIVATTGAVNTNSIAAGAVVPNSLVASTGSGWSWASWSPTLTNLTLGNGTQVATYVQIGKIVFGRWSFTLGTTSVVGTGPIFSLPVTASTNAANNGIMTIGRNYILDSGTTNYVGSLQLITSTTAAPTVEATSGTYNQLVSPTATLPFTFGNLDQIVAEFFYEAA